MQDLVRVRNDDPVEFEAFDRLGREDRNLGSLKVMHVVGPDEIVLLKRCNDRLVERNGRHDPGQLVTRLHGCC